MSRLEKLLPGRQGMGIIRIRGKSSYDIPCCNKDKQKKQKWRGRERNLEVMEGKWGDWWKT